MPDAGQLDSSKKIGFDKVSELLGKEMSKAYIAFLQKLAAGEIETVSKGGEDADLTQTDLVDFFSVLGGASMDIHFVSKVPSGARCVFDAGKLFPSKVLKGAAIEGSISIGVGIKF